MISRLDLGSGQGSGSGHTRLQNRPQCSNRLSQAMPYRITLTVRPGYCGEWAPASGHRRLPPWSHRPGSAASPPATRTNAAKSAPGQSCGSFAIANPGS